MIDAFAALRALDGRRFASARESGLPVIGLIGSAIPVEIVLAAGCYPLPLLARAEDYAASAAPMEQGMEAESRSLFLQAISGHFDFCDLIVVASTSDAYRYLYQYLKEMARTGQAPDLPPLLLYDFLFGPSEAVMTYSRGTMQGLITRLSVLTGQPADAQALTLAIADTNAVREGLARLGQLRAERKVSGSDAHAAIITGAHLPPRQFATLLNDAVSTASAAPKIDAPRLLFVSAVPLYHTHLHHAVEAAGAVVGGEDGEWGAERAGTPIAVDMVAPDALFDHYRRHTPCARRFTDEREAWICGEFGSSFDGVVFYVPPEDQYFGWRYPALNDAAMASGLKTVLIRNEVLDSDQMPMVRQQISEFINLIGGAQS